MIIDCLKEGPITSLSSALFRLTATLIFCIVFTGMFMFAAKSMLVVTSACDTMMLLCELLFKWLISLRLIRVAALLPEPATTLRYSP